MSNKNNNTRRIVFIAILVAQAMVLNFIERFIPMTMIIPGAKLGLANIVTLTSLYMLSFKDAFSIVILRNFLAAVTFGSVYSLLYSLSGGLLSLFAMALVLKLKNDNISMVGTSIIGATFHNIGQLIMAGIVINNILILSYLPFLLVLAIPTGIFVGFVTQHLVRYLQKTNAFNGIK